MLNYKNLFKNVYGDILIARKLVMKRASQLRKIGLNLSQSLKKAWGEAKKLVQEVVNKLKAYRLYVDKQSFTIEGNDAEDIVDLCLEKIEEVKGKRFAYNVVNNLNARWDNAISSFNDRGTLTFAQNVFLRQIRI